MDPNFFPAYHPQQEATHQQQSHPLPNPHPNQTNSAAHVLSGLSRAPLATPHHQQQHPMYDPGLIGVNQAFGNGSEEGRGQQDDSGDDFSPEDPYGRRASGSGRTGRPSVDNGNLNGGNLGNGHDLSHYAVEPPEPRERRTRAPPTRYDETSAGEEDDGDDLGEDGNEEDGGQESFEGEREGEAYAQEDDGTAAAGGDEHEPLYVNAKQYHRILKRRMARARLEEMGRLSRERKVRSSC
ncbi:nuclear transcription factor Y, alpha, partial [Phenoliferia sp. Uapishka_3]